MDPIDEAEVYRAYGRSQRASDRATSPSSLPAVVGWFVLFPAAALLPGVAAMTYALFAGGTMWGWIAAGLFAGGLFVVGRVLCRLQKLGRVRIRGGFLVCPDPREIEVQVAAWWLLPGLSLGAGLWILGMALREWWLLPVAIATIVAFFVLEARRQRRTRTTVEAHYKSKP